MYLKIAPTQLFDGYMLHPNDSVLISKNNIVQGIVPLCEAGDDVQFINGLLCPGFVNAHCHLELSYMHNLIPSNTGMIAFIQQVMALRNMPKNIIINAIASAEGEMIKNGIVAVGDVSNTNNSIYQKQKNNLLYTNFIEISGLVPNAAIVRYENGLQVLQQFTTAGLAAQLVPHAPYSVSNKLLQLIYNNYVGGVTTMHINESAAEVQFMQNATGPMLELYDSLGINIHDYTTNLNYTLTIPTNTKSNIWVHNVVTNSNDMAVMQGSNANNYLCLCPNANLYIGNGLPNIPLLMESGLPICLGTDSLASNYKLCILSEIKTILKYYPTIPVTTVLQWATSNGAKALNISATHGSFERGKCATYVQLPLIEHFL